MATCPAGHESTTDDYCDTCGAPIEATATTPPSGSEPDGPAGTPAAEAPGLAPAPEPAEPERMPCPGCGAAVLGRFCESCGYDVESGQAPAQAAVTLTLSADRGHWARMVGSGEPAFPPAIPALVLELTGDRVTLGRVRTGATPDVDLALTGAAADPGVSHHQCEFVRNQDGATWVVQDSGSSNGTWINDADEPLADGQTHTLAEGDRVFVGAWTCLTVHLAA